MVDAVARAAVVVAAARWGASTGCWIDGDAALERAGGERVPVLR